MPPLRAAILTGPGQLSINEIDPPNRRPDEALVRVRSVGLCGTDRKIVSGAIPVTYPRVIGHEIAGEIEAAGGPSAGTRVLVDPGITCGRCAQCGAGRGNICTGGWLLGRDRDGGLQEQMLVPPDNLHALPDAIPTDIAPLIQVLATCVHAQRLTPPVTAESVVILGLGVTGLLHLQLAKLRGSEPIVCVTRSEAKLRLASELGADATVQADASGPEQLKRVVPDGADLVIECVGSVSTLGLAVEIAAVGGRVLAYGTIPERGGSFPFYDLYFKEIVLASPRSASAEDFPEAIDAVASGRIELANLVSSRFPLDDAGTAVEAAGRSGELKTLIEL